MTQSLPPITVTADDFDRLLPLARAAARAMPEVAVYLLGELDRAAVADTVPPRTVAMGSTVTYRAHDSSARRRVTLVYPDAANLAEGRLSILTPVGAALLGLSEGQSIAWRTPDGETRTLVVEEVG